MAVKIKLMRLGKIRQPYYRIVVADARTRRNGRAIETIGKYHPKDEPSLIQVDSERAQYWLGVGAQPTESVQRILEVTGDWQTFRGLPGAEGTLRFAEQKPDKQAVFNAALAEAGSDPSAEATTPKKRSTKKSEPKDKAADTVEGKPKATKDAKAKSAKVEDKPAKADDKPAKADKADDKPVKAEQADQAEPDKPAKAEDKPVKADKADDKPVKADQAEPDKPAKAAAKPKAKPAAKADEAKAESEKA